MNKPFSLLIKPASADCNLRCEYCFYLDHCDFYPEARRHRMTDEVLEQMVRTYMASMQPSYQFGWQGGEPTLMGLSFFRRVVQLQQQYGRSGTAVANGLQTNGTLIDDELAAHLAEYRFLTGVSLDGPRRIHDLHRKNGLGAGSYADVRRGIDCLQRHNAEFNILVLVSDANVNEPLTVYDFLRSQGFRHHQYIPCVEPAPDGGVMPFSVDARQWGEFLCTLFDTWFADDTRRVSVRLFDAVLALLVDGVRNICHFGRNCCQYFVVEYNGDVFPCDFFVEKPLRLGNVGTDSWETLQQSPVYLDFGRRKAQWNDMCGACEWNWICAGDCLKHRLCAGGGSPRRLSHLCEAWKIFFPHTMPRFRQLAQEIQTERVRAAAVQPSGSPGMGALSPGRTPGRNDPCPCGSGRKFKRCCGR